MTVTDTTTVELDDTLRAVVSRLAALQEQRTALDAEDKRLKAEIRQRLSAGQKGTVGGQPVVSVAPNRRFQPAVASEVLPRDLLNLCKVTVVDSKAAKAVLPPALYEQCMAEVGEPVVKLV